jgi:rubrerythrin
VSDREYIERGAFIEKLKEKITTNYLNLYDEDTLESTIRLAEKQPAADVEPVVRGEWERFEEQDFFTIYDGLKCSICGSKYNPESAKNYKFCPNCGAHMERSGSGE